MHWNRHDNYVPQTFFGFCFPIIKVFRFKQKTLLLFFGFCFFIIIKVFRFNGRPYCYSSVSFSSSYFFLLHFSKTPERIFMKFSGMVYIVSERPTIIFREMTLLSVRDINDFLIFGVSFCSEIFSETTEDFFFKFSQIVDKRLKFVSFESQVSSSKSAEAR